MKVLRLFHELSESRMCPPMSSRAGPFVVINICCLISLPLRVSILYLDRLAVLLKCLIMAVSVSQHTVDKFRLTQRSHEP